MSMQSQGREITYLRLSITDKCNLRCRYCMPDEGMPQVPHDNLLRVEEIYRVLALFAQSGIEKLRITGGEPTVSKMLLPLLDNIKPLGFKDVSLTTNGLLLDKLASVLYENGVKRINISLDTLNPQRFTDITRGGDLNKVLKGIDTALATGFNPIKINTVAVKGFNDDEFIQLALLSKDRLLHVRFIELMPIGTNGYWSEKNFITGSDIMKILEPLGVLKPAKLYGNGPAKVYRIPGFTGTVGFIPAISNHFCADCNRLRLTSDGKLYPCLHHSEYFDFFPLLRNNAPDEEILALIMKAVAEKPLRHDYGSQTRNMGTIGG